MTLPNHATKVLIGEDDDDDYLIFSLAIEETSYKILLTRATDGKMVLSQLEKELPDILFLDLNLMVMDGRQCLKEIRGNRKYDSLPIIIYTSYDDLTSIEYCYREGSNLYVIKPSTVGDLKYILERILAIDWKKIKYFPSKSDFVIRSA
jgi:CheY-like chemotaxis protein